MKIIHTCPVYHPSVGGNPTHIKTLSEKIAALNEHVSVFTSAALTGSQYTTENLSITSLPTSEISNNVHIKRFDINYPLVSLLKNRIIKVKGVYRLLNFILGDNLDFFLHGPVVKGMLGMIKREKPDIIMATNNYAFTFYLSIWAKQFYKIPLVLMPIIHFGEEWSVKSAQLKLYRKADMIISCTEFEKRYLINNGLPEHKVTVAPLGVPLEKPADQKLVEQLKSDRNLRSPIVAFIGSMIHGKGVDTLIEAMKIVWRQHPRATLLLAGKRSENFGVTLGKLLDELGPEEKNKVVDIDHFKESEKNALFASVDVLVMASKVDAFGIAYLEAWMQGKPVIGCRNMPQETIIDDGINGALVEYGNVNELAGILSRILDDPDLRQRMGERGRQKVLREYNLDTYAERIRDIYKDVLTGIDE